MVRDGFPNDLKLLAQISEFREVRMYIVVFSAMGILKFAPEIDNECSGSPLANLLQIVSPLPRLLSFLDTIGEVVGDTVHNEGLDSGCLIIVFPSHGGLDAIDIAAIDVRLSH